MTDHINIAKNNNHNNIQKKKKKTFIYSAENLPKTLQYSMLGGNKVQTTFLEPKQIDLSWI